MDFSQLFSHLPIPLHNLQQVYYNLSAPELIEHTLRLGQGQLADSGALVVSTGEFTGRSPKDKFVVVDSQTAPIVWWGDINHRFPQEKFDSLLLRITAYLQQKTVYVRDCFAGADTQHQIKVRVLNENPWQNLFVHNLFIRPTKEQLQGFIPDFTILAVPGFKAIPEIDGTRQHNFTIIDFSRKLILIGGSAYTGEIKKGIFTVLNYLLPQQNSLPMHCSANIGKDDKVAIFFGLSGTGKTTLSADPDRRLIGDDEHGWTDTGVFNFEGGCYAKCIDLSYEKEPQIWRAIKSGTLLENITFHPGSRSVNFQDKSITENTRAAYPIHYIPNALEPSIGGIPENIFFLTADAFGVLPPISRLTPGQAMYHFISGYTAKVAGTEAGVTEPQPTFSACFGQAFLPLHPTRYAQLLGAKLKKYATQVWLINTGWTGGPYGAGSRISLKYTRAMIAAALKGELNGENYFTDPVFGLAIPENVPGVPSEILNPKNTWADPVAYDAKAAKLSQFFNQNFEKFASEADEEIKAAAPVLA